MVYAGPLMEPVHRPGHGVRPSRLAGGAVLARMTTGSFSSPGLLVEGRVRPLGRTQHLLPHPDAQPSLVLLDQREQLIRRRRATRTMPAPTQTMVAASSLSPRRRECAVHGRLGPFHQELGQLRQLVCPGDPGRGRSRQQRLVLSDDSPEFRDASAPFIRHRRRPHLLRWCGRR